jgi:hypothetical protein
MYTSILAIALASAMNSVQTTDGIAWQAEYKAAQANVLKTGKPLAIFIGTGDQGWNKVVREGNLSPEARQNLNQHFTCVYVNTATAEGKALAQGFEIQTRGLVISDVKGNKQAFSHAGDLTQDEVKTVLVKYADVKTVAATETLGRTGDGYVAKPAPVYYGGCANGRCSQPVQYAPSNCANGRCPQPVQYAAPSNCATGRCPQQAAPIYINNGNCPNGRCPNQR